MTLLFYSVRYVHCKQDIMLGKALKQTQRNWLNIDRHSNTICKNIKETYYGPSQQGLWIKG